MKQFMYGCCCRRLYSTTITLWDKDSDKDNKDNKRRRGPMKLANILQHASQKSRDILNGAIHGTKSSTTTTTSNTNSHPAHHFAAGGTTCDPPPQPYHLADYGEDSLYTLVLLRHGESEWNSLNRKFIVDYSMYCTMKTFFFFLLLHFSNTSCLFTRRIHWLV
jgi:hypothetical protein